MQKKKEKSWTKKRGIELWGGSAQILVKAPLSQVFSFLSSKAAESHSNVLGTLATYHYPLTITYQLEGHDWSGILSEIPSWEGDLWGTNEIAEEISKQLNTTVLEVTSNDTVMLLHYSIYESGKIIEYFLGSPDEIEAGEFELALPTKQHIFASVPEDSEFPEEEEELGFVLFWSNRRNLDDRINGRIWDFTEKTLEDYDALFFAIEPKYFLGDPESIEEGQTYRFQTPPLTSIESNGRKVASTPVFVGVDHFLLSPRS